MDEDKDIGLVCTASWANPRCLPEGKATRLQRLLRSDKADGWVPGGRGAGSPRRPERMFWGDGKVLYLDGGDGLTTTRACKHVFNSALKRGQFYCKQMPPQHIRLQKNVKEDADTRFNRRLVTVCAAAKF